MNINEPWKAAAPLPDSRSDQPGNRRYQRGVRLSQMIRDITRFVDVPYFAPRIAYWRECVERWEDYLDGKIAPPPGKGRKPTVDE